MSIDLYNPRSMMQALLQMKPPRTFLRSKMIRRDEFSDREQIDVDTKTGVRRLAPFVNPATGVGKAMDRIGFSTSTVTPPMVSVKRALTPTDLQKRLPGENIYSTQTADERAAQLLGQDLAEIDEDCTRVEEWMCAQAAFNTGTVNGQKGTIIHCVGDDVDETFFFPRNAALIDAAPTASPSAGLGMDDPTSTQIANTERWDQSTAHIPTQFRQVKRLIAKLTGLSCDYAICGSDAADALLSAPSLNGLGGLLNTRRLDLGLIKPEDMGEGVTYLGTLGGTNIDIFAYDEYYIDPTDGEEKAIVPEKSVLFGCSSSYTVMRYGAVGVTSGVDQQAQLALIAGRRIPQSWVNAEPAVRMLKLSSRPLVVPVQNDGYATVQVLT
jgi:Phage major capsid protein E